MGDVISIPTSARFTDKQIGLALRGVAAEEPGIFTGVSLRYLDEAASRGLAKFDAGRGEWSLTEQGKTFIREWHVVVSTTEFGAELKALFHLRERGYIAWLPLCERWEYRNGKAAKIVAPLFSRYLFVQRVAGMRIGPLVNKSIKNVQELLCTSTGRPHIVPEEQVSNWYAAMNSGDGVIHLAAETDKRTWNHRAHVRITEGPLQGRTGYVMGPHFVRPKDIVLLELDNDSGNMRVSARDEALELCSPEPHRMPKASQKSAKSHHLRARS